MESGNKNIQQADYKGIMKNHKARGIIIKELIQDNSVIYSAAT